MSAILNAKRAAERLLTNLSPALPTAYEGVAFTAPDGLYQRCQFMIASPDDPVFPAGYHRERIQFQVFVVGKVGVGTAEVITRAELIRSSFYKGKTMIESGTRIHILETPQISGTMVTNERIVCPVLIDLIAEVYS